MILEKKWLFAKTSKETISVSDAEAGTILDISDGKVKFSIAPHDYRVVWVK